MRGSVSQGLRQVSWTTLGRSRGCLNRSLTLSVASIGQFLIHPVIGLAVALIVRRAAHGGAPE